MQSLHAELDKLTPKEQEVLALGSEGSSDQAIANSLGISVNTVSVHWTHIRAKLGPLSRTELVALKIRCDVESKLAQLRKERDELEALTVSHPNVQFHLALLEALPVALCAFDNAGSIAYANSEFSQSFHIRREDLPRQSYKDLHPMQTREWQWQQLRRVFLRSGSIVLGLQSSFAMQSRDGSVRRVVVRANSVRSPQGPLAVSLICPFPPSLNPTSFDLV